MVQKAAWSEFPFILRSHGFKAVPSAERDSVSQAFQRNKLTGTYHTSHTERAKKSEGLYSNSRRNMTEKRNKTK
jgi:hypothetical protein